MSLSVALENLSVVFPAYNEEGRIGPTLNRVHAYLSERSRNFEIIVVDDGSEDSTALLVRRMAQEKAEITLLQNRSNRGKGYSVRYGVLHATGSYVLFSDADLSTPIEEIEKLWPRLQRCSVVIGSRAISGAQIEIHQPQYREIMGKAFNRILQSLLLPGIRDSQCGFKLFSAPVARDLFSRLTVHGFGFDVEILYLARRLGYTICEVPVRWRNDPETRVRILRDSLQMLLDILALRLRYPV